MNYINLHLNRLTYININNWCYDLLVGLLLNVEHRVFYCNIFQQLRILRQVRKNLWKITSIDWQWLTDMGKLLPWENPLFTLTYIERCINFDIILSQKHIYNKILSWNYMQSIEFFENKVYFRTIHLSRWNVRSIVTIVSCNDMQYILLPWSGFYHCKILLIIS